MPFFTVLISVSIYALNDASFSYLTRYISHLGSGPNGVGIVFNVGIMISSLTMIFFFLNMSAFLRRKKANTILIDIAFVSGVISSTGSFFIGVFPYTFMQGLHNISATFFFMGGFAYCIFYGISEWITQDISKLQASSGFIVGFFYLLFIIFTAINYFNPTLASEQSHITEWMLISALMVWIIIHEAAMYRDKKHNLKES